MLTQGRWATLSIADSGPGLPQELRNKLFEPFAAAGAHAGSGLGLAICREIVSGLGGSIDLLDREGQGRVLGLSACVRLPLEQAA